MVENHVSFKRSIVELSIKKMNLQTFLSQATDSTSKSEVGKSIKFVSIDKFTFTATEISMHLKRNDVLKYKEGYQIRKQ